MNGEGSNTNNNNPNNSSNWEQERLLPIANVGRIMKQILPKNAKISKEAKETMQECVSEFIAFVTSEGSNKCRREKRKTVNGDDVCWALGTLGFDDYALSLRRYLQRYRDFEGDHYNANPGTNANNDSISGNNGDQGGDESDYQMNLVPMAISTSSVPSYSLHQGSGPSSSTSAHHYGHHHDQHHQSRWLN